MTDKAEDVKALLDANITADDVIARLKRIIAMRTGATGQQVFEDLPRDAISIIASQAAEIERLRAHIERGHEIHERLTNFSSHSMEWDMALDEAIAYLSGDTP